MAGRETAEVRRALRLVEQGLSCTAAAARAGVSRSALIRARQRRELPALPSGRPAKAAAPG